MPSISHIPLTCVEHRSSTCYTISNNCNAGFVEILIVRGISQSSFTLSGPENRLSAPLFTAIKPADLHIHVSLYM